MPDSSGSRFFFLLERPLGFLNASPDSVLPWLWSERLSTTRACTDQ